MGLVGDSRQNLLTAYAVHSVSFPSEGQQPSDGPSLFPLSGDATASTALGKSAADMVASSVSAADVVASGGLTSARFLRRSRSHVLRL